jgi:hypothetical protein
MNKLCQSCQRGCKQTDLALIVECKRYRAVPVQMVIKFKNPKKTRRIKDENEV